MHQAMRELSNCVYYLRSEPFVPVAHLWLEYCQRSMEKR